MKNHKRENQPGGQGPSTNRNLVMAAMFTAMITLSTAYLFRIPMGGNGGYLHFGDAFIYLGACFLPMPWGLAAAAAGAGLADVLAGAPIWVIPTVIIKPLAAACFTSKRNLLCRRNLIAMVPAGLISLVGYYLAEVYFYGSWVAPLAFQWAGLVQAIGSAVVFAVLAAALDRADAKHRFGFAVTAGRGGKS